MSDAATALLQGPCAPYVADGDITDEEICRVGSGEVGGITTTDLDGLRAAATDIVWVLLGRPNIGVCEVTVYPCALENHWRWWSRNAWGSGDFGGCHGCGENGAIRLDAPVVDVGEVVVDAEVLDPTDYYLLNGIWLVRSGGSWPAGGVGDAFADFSITYSFGEAVSQLVRDATGEVVVDLYRSRPGQGGAFPARTTSVSRQGVSFSLESEADRVKRAGMSLPALSKAIAVYNPLQQPHQSWVWSPDEAYKNRRVRTF